MFDTCIRSVLTRPISEAPRLGPWILIVGTTGPTLEPVERPSTFAVSAIVPCSVEFRVIFDGVSSGGFDDADTTGPCAPVEVRARFVWIPSSSGDTGLDSITAVPPLSL